MKIKEQREQARQAIRESMALRPNRKVKIITKTYVQKGRS